MTSRLFMDITYKELILQLCNKRIKKSEVWRERDYCAKSNPEADVYLYNTIKKNLVEELTKNKGMPLDGAIAKVTEEAPAWKVSLFGKQYAKKYLHPLCRANKIEVLLNRTDLHNRLVFDYHFKGLRRNKIVILLKDENRREERTSCFGHDGGYK